MTSNAAAVLNDLGISTQSGNGRTSREFVAGTAKQEDLQDRLKHLKLKLEVSEQRRGEENDENDKLKANLVAELVALREVHRETLRARAEVTHTYQTHIYQTHMHQEKIHQANVYQTNMYQAHIHQAHIHPAHIHQTHIQQKHINSAHSHKTYIH